jgi:hypothetical protein
MRRFLLKLVTTLALCSILLALSQVGFAQRRGPYRGSAYARADVNTLIHRVEDRSDAFVKIFDSALDRSRLDGTHKEDRLNDKAKELEKQLDKVRDEFDDKEDYRDVREHVEKALSVSEEINKVVRNRRMNYEVQRQWAMLRAELNRLARVYNIRPLK